MVNIVKGVYRVPSQKRSHDLMEGFGAWSFNFEEQSNGTGLLTSRCRMKIFAAYLNWEIQTKIEIQCVVRLF